MAQLLTPRAGTSTGPGIAMALVSAATFGSSGAMAKSLLDTGWTSGAAVLVRLGGAAAVLCLAALLTMRHWRPRAAAVRRLVTYGVVAMAGAQLSFFNAVRTLDVGVALLLEFLAPVLLLGWTSLRTRTRPSGTTLLGAGSTVVGLAFVLELTGTGSVDPVGVAWGLLAAVCLGAFFLLSAERDDQDLPPLVMAAGGTTVGAAVIGLAGITGVLPLSFATEDAVLAGAAVSWIVPAVWLAVVATALAYLTGIGAILRLGTRTASFVGLTEVLFAVVIAWGVVGQRPGLSQLVGGICIVAGIVVIQRQERLAPATPTASVEAVHPV